jgi:tetratricopeptide (TPR) repeat protein
MSYRQRRSINWINVICLLIGAIGIGSLLYQHYGVPRLILDLPIFPKPTPTATPVIDDGAALLAHADSLFDQGRLDDAANQYGETIAATEKAIDDFSFLADKLDVAGKTSEANARRTDAQNTLLRSATAYARRCKILALRHKTAEAISSCNKAIEINSRSAEAYANLALAYDRNNDFDKSIAAAQRAVDLDPQAAEGYAFLAEAYADKSPFDKRNMDTAKKAVQINNKSGFAYRDLGWVYETEGSYDQAATAYLTATQMMPNMGYFYLDLCRAQRIRGLSNEAVAACQKATEVDPQNPETFDRLGLLYFDRFDNQKALDQFLQAEQVDPTYAIAYGHEGWVHYFRLYAWEQAAAAFEKALQLAPNKLTQGTIAEFYTELGWSYYRLARCSDARPDFDRAISLLARDFSPGAANIVQQAQDGLTACAGKK